MALAILSVRLISNDYVLLQMIEWKADFSGNLGRKARYYDDIKTKQHPILRLLLPVATVARERTKRKLELRFSQTRMSQTQISLTVFVVASVTKVQHLWYVRGRTDKKRNGYLIMSCSYSELCRVSGELLPTLLCQVSSQRSSGLTSCKACIVKGIL